MTDFAGIVAGWLLPMFDRPGPMLADWVPIAVATAYCLALAFVIHRRLDTGPLVRGTARWRYRSRALRERVARARTTLVLVDRTSGWWATRIEFAVAIAAIVSAVAVVLTAAAEPTFGGDPPMPLFPLGGIAVMLVGLAWMVRIYRAPLRLDSTAYWRYHDGS